MDVREIKVDSITQNENSRVVYKASDLADLMRSMSRTGLLQPVGVKEYAPGKYEAVFGNRRIQAAKKLGWDVIQASVLDAADTDTERDIIGLIENIKRVNTTLAEDGRMFLILKDRGLTEAEIAARLDISVERVNTAIEVHRHVPTEYRPVIVNRVTGSKKAGTISATAAHTIMNVRKAHSLNRTQTRQLLEYARTEDASTQHIGSLAPLMKEGLTVAQALEAARSMERVTLFFFMDQKRIQKLEKKYKTTINDILMKSLEKNTEFQVQRSISAKYRNRARNYSKESA